MRRYLPRFLPRLILVAGVCAGMLVGGSSALASQRDGSSSTLVIGWSQDPTTMDPTGVISNSNVWVYVNIYDQLLRIAPNGKKLVPDLATTWKVTNGGKTYMFTLRKGVKFSNGQALKASDIVFCIKRALQPASSFSWIFPKFKSITAPKNSTVVLKLKSPWAPLLSDMALYAVGVYPESYFKSVGASGLANNPVGTGPYELKSWNKGTELILQKNPHYWNSKVYPMQEVDFKVIQDDSSRLAAAQTGTIDVDNVLPSSLIPAAKSGGGLKVAVNASTEIIYVTLNDKLPQFKDAKVREAIDHAIDRKQLVKTILNGNGTPANSYMPKGALYWDSSLPVPKYDVSEAKKLMSQSHFKKGFSMTMEIPGGDQEYSDIGTILQSELKQIGIKLNLTTVDPATLQSEQQADHFHMLPTNWTNDIPDPDELTSFAVDGVAGAHTFFTWYSDKTLNKLTTEGERQTNASKRKSIYDQIQARWASDTPYYALYYEPFINAVSTSVHGFFQTPFGYFNLQGVTKS